MKQGHVFIQVNNFLMNKAVDVLYLLYKIGQVFFITVILKVNPDVMKKR
jgi:hypothetical protein